MSNPADNFASRQEPTSTRSGEPSPPTVKWVVGMMDEVEFNRSPAEAASHPVYGPFYTYESAAEYAKTLSSDPDEAVVMELRLPALSRQKL